MHIQKLDLKTKRGNYCDSAVHKQFLSCQDQASRQFCGLAMLRRLQNYGNLCNLMQDTIFWRYFPKQQGYQGEHTHI